jgi:hypothetical protein
MAIQLRNYEAAVRHLINAGSRTAPNVHIPHGPGAGAVPDGFGRQPLIDATILMLRLVDTSRAGPRLLQQRG